MSFDVDPVQPGFAAAPVSRIGRVAPDPAPAGAISGDTAVKADTFPTQPPPEVKDAIGVAAHVYNMLAADQRELHFELNPDNERVTIQVRDLDGRVLRTIPASKALEIAAGRISV
jgi:hypothetical protein